MKLYSVKVRLAGSLLNEVWVQNATASEILVLQRVHDVGSNAPIAEVKETGSVVRVDAKERARLVQKFLEWNLGRGSDLIKEVLGSPGAPLPQEYVPPVTLADEEYDEDAERALLNAPDEVIEQLATPVDVLKPVRTAVHRNHLNTPKKD